MSVAFVKEPNEDQVEVLPDRDLGSDPNIVTPRGLKMIDDELEALNAQRATAREAKDKVALATIHRDMRYWNARRATAKLVKPDQNPQTVQFGTRVTIERDDGQKQSFTIVGIDEADPRDGYLSYLSPLARNLVGKNVGEEVKVGASNAEIVSIAVG
ncbi:nucleoside diphosphate kinase regulator [Fulvimarina pelagi HTCC2506]|uniref:Nucleoside diphosphate kinase regulator n=2 Tax=Fulvimarina pelagi TaxID=217511 RepID=Q0G189_9HYPH|nr:GreA/GreB family elongation factor [Fulvimarina pelagi]EAU41192.1 nucleoside diphosphate kinase regulator [Fulvimarina pelagi HTCC2506]BAT30797.1 nucleoside diphosphate kinase regulator [Fulvimarina pelagi]